MKRILFVISIVVTCMCYWSCAIVNNGERHNCWIVNIVDDNVYLDGDSFVTGTILGEIPIELLWSISKTSCNKIEISASVWTARSREFVPYSTIYLVEKNNEIYNIVDTVHFSDSTGHFLLKIEEQKLVKYHLAVYVPGCRAMVYHVNKAILTSSTDNTEKGEKE